MRVEGVRTVACPAPYGVGGLGHHLRCAVEEIGPDLPVTRYFCTGASAGDPRAREISTPAADWLSRYSPVRFLPGWGALVGAASFDRAVARRLERGTAFTGFAGAARASFRRARRLGYEALALEAATSHVGQVCRRHRAAHTAFPIERGWLNGAYVRRAMDEYRMADEIVVPSEYVRQSFVAAGIEPGKLRRRYLPVDERFRPARGRPKDGTFRVVYTGSLTVTKGVPLLVEAFSRLQAVAELTLVGGWATRGMRRYLERNMERDRRIAIRPGDPLPHLQQADVYVHPSYQEGLGLAPLEAMACGVPVVVTEDTGMKEYVTEGVNGYVVPTGSWRAILDRLEALCQGR